MPKNLFAIFSIVGSMDYFKWRKSQFIVKLYKFIHTFWNLFLGQIYTTLYFCSSSSINSCPRARLRFSSAFSIYYIIILVYQSKSRLFCFILFLQSLIEPLDESIQFGYNSVIFVKCNSSKKMEIIQNILKRN